MNKVKPTDDHVLVKLEEENTTERLVISLKKDPLVKGVVEDVGPDCCAIQVGDIVSFYKKSALEKHDLDHLIIKEENIELIHGKQGDIS
jgi:co-chaperonin GroES (HSP10)